MLWEQGPICRTVRDAGAEAAGQGCPALGRLQVANKEPRWRGPRLSLLSRVSILTPNCRVILSATFKEKVDLSCVLDPGVGVVRLSTTYPNRSWWPRHCCSKQKPASGLAVADLLSPTPQ